MSTTLYESRDGGLQITRISKGMGSVAFVIDLHRGQLECSPRDVAELLSALKHSRKVRGALVDAFERDLVEDELIPKGWREDIAKLRRRRA